MAPSVKSEKQQTAPSVVSQHFYSSPNEIKMATAGKSMGTLAVAFHQRINLRYSQSCCSLQVRNYAARKGTREKAKKKKVKVEVKKVGFIPHNLRFKKTDILTIDQARPNDACKSDCSDDVWLGKYHKWKVYPFEEAIQCHRETHHPTVYNLPDSFVNAFIELDMTGERATKIVEGFARTVDIPCPFNHGEHRSVMAFAKDPQLLEIAEKAGAAIVGGSDLITKVQTGEISVNDYTAAVAHPEIMADLSVIRGLMKRKFPTPRSGSLGLDLAAMIKKVLYGIKYSAIPHERQQLYGRITVPIGRLNMEWKDMEKNFVSIIEDIEKVRPKREGQFITRTSLLCPPSHESLKIDFEQYFKKVDDENASYESDDDEEIVRSNVI